MDGTKLLTVSQAATELDLTRQAVQLMIDDERIHALWLFEKWLIPESEVKRIKKERQPNGKRPKAA